MARGWRSLLSSPGWPIAAGKRAARWCSGRTGGRCCSVGRKSTACRRNHAGLGVSNASTVLKSPVDCGRDVARGMAAKAGRRGRDGCWVSVLLLAVGRMPRSGPGKARCREKVVGANRCPRAGICRSCLNFSDVKSRLCALPMIGLWSPVGDRLVGERNRSRVWGSRAGKNSSLRPWEVQDLEETTDHRPQTTAHPGR